MKTSDIKIRMAAHAVITIFIGVSVLHALGSMSAPHPILLGMAVVSIGWLVTSRTTWLPFLGPSAFPHGVLKPRIPPKATRSVVIDAPDDAHRVVFWASTKESDNPYDAYGRYTNAGVTDVVDGKAVLRVRDPHPYTVGMMGKKTLQPHIHYRWIRSSGLLSDVQTIFV